MNDPAAHEAAERLRHARHAIETEAASLVLVAERGGAVDWSGIKACLAAAAQARGDLKKAMEDLDTGK